LTVRKQNEVHDRITTINIFLRIKTCNNLYNTATLTYISMHVCVPILGGYLGLNLSPSFQNKKGICETSFYE
jgi:hypothetical protein